MSLLSRLAVAAAKGYGALTRVGSPTNISVDYLVVAGGAGGAGAYTGGGGGAGGYQTSTVSLSTLNTYSITVGGGGAGNNTTGGTGTSGSNSVLSGTGLSTVTSTGGGGGGGATPGSSGTSGASGGSGGGGGSVGSLNGAGGAGTSGQGNNGGAGNGINGVRSVGGGGGGAGAVGGTSSSTTGGAGGAGSSSSISGSSVTYAGGGGGGSDAGSGGTGGAGGGGNGGGSAAGTAATANTGGGGGGGGLNNTGASGGSGIVIISYTSAAPKFVGGTITTSGGKQIHTFTSSGTLTPVTQVTASYLVVAGGAGGGTNAGGGGGAGGLLSGSTTLYSPATYIVTVGAGGAGGAGGGNNAGSNGSNSLVSGTGLTTITSTGGGGGGKEGSPPDGASGGSGGGGHSNGATIGVGGTGTSGQGNNGGSGATNNSTYRNGGGGGGAGAVGATATSGGGGAGGNGSASSISGSSVTYAGGGGGGSQTASAGGSGGTGGGGNGIGGTGGAVGVPGTTNLGGGGGAGAGGLGAGGSGGSGVVIISYAGSQVFNGGTVTTSGGNTIHTFYATGALTPITNNLTNSLRFRSSASAYLSRTPTIAGSQTTWTWSAWVKRGTLGAQQKLFTAGSSGSLFASFEFIAGDNLQFYAYNGATNAYLVTTQVFRDPSAWYHIVWAIDTTQATAANRMKLYVNGNQVTAFSTSTYPSQNFAFPINNNVIHNIGRDNINNTNYLDGYLTDINFIDGQQLESYYFGSNDSNNVWKPIKYYGTYGTNGFYLTFSNTTSTTTLGYDSSPNGNNWTTNGISVTAGNTYDAMTDVPTNTSATAANYATLNPVLQNSWWAAVNRGTITNGNLTHASGGNTTAFSNFDLVANSGKWYYELTCGATDTANAIVIAALSRSTFEVGYYQNGNKQINGATPAAYGSSWTSGDVIGVAIDVPNNTITFYKNNTSQGAITNTFPSQTVYAGSYYNTTSGDYNYNFGQRPFSYTPPSGYVAMNTYNLSTPTIIQGNRYMDATLFTGNGVGQSVVNNAQFKPDFVWWKDRQTTGIWHMLSDSVRGTGKTLSSNQTDAEYSGYTSLTAFNNNGFTLGLDTGTGYFGWNTSGKNYVAWQWQAGSGSTSSNTSGTITSTTSVNATAGFSIVTYTGTGSNATVGHGLGVAPAMIITKYRGVESWAVYHKSTGNTQYLVLNATSAAASASTVWQNTSPTSTVFSIGTAGLVNTSGGSGMLAYCWAEIAGFSKFGSYTGNGSADGPFVYLGFRPKFVMIKNVTTAGYPWVILDSARNTYNPENLELYPNTSGAEASGGTTYIEDFLSNGFKVRQTDATFNASGSTYIYMAFAENPFKYDNAR